MKNRTFQSLKLFIGIFLILHVLCPIIAFVRLGDVLQFLPVHCGRCQPVDCQVGTTNFFKLFSQTRINTGVPDFFQNLSLYLFLIYLKHLSYKMYGFHHRFFRISDRFSAWRTPDLPFFCFWL